jgi:tetratricopeptide (TPR) repeat protein
MATTKKKAAASPDETTTEAVETTRTPQAKPRNIAAYEAAVEEFTAASALFVKGSFAEALPRFEAVAAAASADEPILADRARTYASICARRTSAPAAGAADAETQYHLGVVAANAGRLDEAWAHLEKASADRPNDASILYARASVRGLQGNTEGAAAELKKAVALDPKFRYQATSDSDFDKVRDEAAFIDIIEPSSAGA